MNRVVPVASIVIYKKNKQKTKKQTKTKQTLKNIAPSGSSAKFVLGISCEK